MCCIYSASGTQCWIEKEHNLLLKTHYFLVTFTLPCELRSIARSNQNVLYDLFFKSSAKALQKLAKDPRFIGGDIGMMGGLHTLQRDMRNHPMFTLLCLVVNWLRTAVNGCLPALIFLSLLKRCLLSFVPNSVMHSKKRIFSTPYLLVSGNKTGWYIVNRSVTATVR